MGPRLRDASAPAPAAPTPVARPLNMTQRLFKSLTKHTAVLPPSDFTLPFSQQDPITTFFHDAAAAATASDFELPFTDAEKAAAEAVELTWLPPKYNTITRNIYIAKKIPVPPAAASRCTCYSQGGQHRGSSTRPTAPSSPRPKKRGRKPKQPKVQYYCDDTCHNKLVLIECGKDTCSAPDPALCLNRPFQQKSTKATRVDYMGRKGFGLVADEPIDVGGFVVEYLGEVIDDTMAAERRAVDIATGQSHTYMLEIEKDLLIDAQYKGNVSRFINHSCAPNCSAQKWTCEGGVMRIGIVALQPIAVGDEITFDYQFTHVGAHSVLCQCGAATCKGKMGFKDKKELAAKLDEKDESNIAPWPQPIKVSSLALFKGARLNRDWLAEYGFQQKRLFLSHAVPDDVDVDAYFHSTPPSKRSKTNWYYDVLQHPPVKSSSSFLAGGVLDYTKILRTAKTKKMPPSASPRPPRKSFLTSRYQLMKDVLGFAEGSSVWNERLGVTPADLDAARIYRFVENVDNGKHQQNGDTYDLNEDACHRCGTAGQLICCDGCPAAFHLSCAGLHSLPPRNATWYCASCKRAKSVPYVSQRARVQVNPIFQVESAATPEKKRKRKPGRPKRVVLSEAVHASSSPDSEDS
ncbi:Aste57867_10295 [Aphanomyces stellatus]|uniref:Aste57867_10295 protein n=1 Tax=Aphanomyces stellatus TaxID=120398 RepID=A0A485KQH0_9STRA|nr:hypothetical protein As57867_010255 [Aphanomyces stellatus]VFT87169.1 Aste57867_10295 [Aphanomyces stellatus]